MLVEAALGLLEDTSRPVVVDVGTGAGAIALAIADERSDAVVLATDLSPAAVGPRETQCRPARPADRGSPGPPHAGRRCAGRIDLVVSNPPYVALDRMDDLPAEVRAEPGLALAGDVQIYERLAVEAADALRPGGGIAVEIAEDRGGDVADVMAGSFANVLVLRPRRARAVRARQRA